MALNKHSPIPLYYQLVELIKEQIRFGELKPGDQIPAERVLSELHGISRMTTRQAVAYLVREGALVARHGLGTFVAEPKLTHDALHLLGFTEEIMHRGGQAVSRVIEQALVPASARVAAELQPAGGSGAEAADAASASGIGSRSASREGKEKKPASASSPIQPSAGSAVRVQSRTPTSDPGPLPYIAPSLSDQPTQTSPYHVQVPAPASFCATMSRPLRRGRPGKLPPPVERMDELWSREERAFVHHTLEYSYIGSPVVVKRGLEGLVERFAPNELMVTAQVFDHAQRLRSFELVAQAWGTSS